MKVKKQNYDNVVVVELQGEFDIDFIGIFERTIMDVVADGKSGIVLDMTETGFIDSQALEKLLWVRDYCHNNNCQLKLAGLDETCQKILEMTRLEDEFDCYTELAGAVKSFV